MYVEYSKKILAEYLSQVINALINSESLELGGIAHDFFILPALQGKEVVEIITTKGTFYFYRESKEYKRPKLSELHTEKIYSVDATQSASHPQN